MKTEMSYGPDWSIFAKSSCESCNGYGWVSYPEGCIPAGFWPCKCVYDDSKYQPLYKSNKELMFSSSDSRLEVRGYHYWFKSTDPLTMSQPYTEVWEIDCKFSGHQNIRDNTTLYAKSREDFFETCNKLSSGKFYWNIIFYPKDGFERKSFDLKYGLESKIVFENS